MEGGYALGSKIWSVWVFGISLGVLVITGGCSREKPITTPTATSEPERDLNLATPTSVPVSTPTAPDNTHYVVQAGDTLWAIADRFGVALDTLVKANELLDPERLQPGQEIVIPIDSEVASENSSPQGASLQEAANLGPQRSHTVATGENLWSIAERYGTTVDEIATVNGLEPDGLLAIGQQLIIP